MKPMPQKKAKWDLKLVLAISAFVMFDLGALAFNFRIARQVESDAVAINLAGRQRMLSQRVTKASLLAINQERSVTQRTASLKEATAAYRLFQTTLSAFAEGGEATGGEGTPVVLARVRNKAALLVGDVRGALRTWPSVPGTEPELVAFSQFMVENNERFLDSMNRLTSELEHQSVAAVSRLRVAQTLTFSLSIGNFFLILYEMFRAKRRAELDAVTDALTGLKNRAGLYQALTSAIEEFERTGAPLGVILLDLNGFKAVNDTYGHSVGDDTLRETARRLLAWQRPGWVAGRLGGDEFAVICPDVRESYLVEVVADLNEVLSGIPGGELVVSASVGYAAAYGGCDADILLGKADASMYMAKSHMHAHNAYRRTHRQ